MSEKIILFQSGIGDGGATRSNLMIASGLSKKGYNMTLVYGHSSEQNKELIPKNLKSKEIGFVSSLWVIFKLAKFIHKEKPEIVVAGKIQANNIVYLAKILSLTNPKIIFIDRVAPSIEIKNKKGIIYRLLPYLMRLLYRKADKVVAVSQECAEDISSIVGDLGDRLAVIYNPSITKDKIAKSKVFIEHPWLTGDVPVVIAVGRLSAQKDFPTLIRAFDLVLKSTECKLLLLGDGEEKLKLENLVQELKLEEHVCLHGYVGNPHPYLRKADLFVLSSAWEGLPNVLLEAMAYGTSVVSTNCVSGPKEILYNGALAPLVEVGDYVAMAKAIVDVLKSPQDPEILSARANDFSEEKSLASYQRLIENLLRA